MTECKKIYSRLVTQAKRLWNIQGSSLVKKLEEPIENGGRERRRNFIVHRVFRRNGKSRGADSLLEVDYPIRTAKKVIIGAAEIQCPGWVATERDSLDV